MSVARVVTVQKSRKDQGKCGKCGVELPAGTGYKFWKMGFRSNYKYKRCLKVECAPKPSERETNKTATILAAQEAFEETTFDFGDVTSLEEAVHSVAESVREVSDEYQEGLDQWEHGNESLQEKVEHYSSQADELESWTVSESEGPEPADYDTEEEHEKACVEWWDRVVEEANEAVNNIDFI